MSISTVPFRLSTTTPPTPRHLVDWAPGLLTSIDRVDGQWVAESGMGPIRLEFAAPNEFGVLDHDVTTESGPTVHNAMRVIPDDEGSSELVFTVRRQPEMSDADFERDQAAVLADLARLRDIVERVRA